ncbi:single-strand binding protein [Frankia sp. EI5c]|uniref:single-stranded DNA-binding protein n=1 Tax=Frankia sp. EI5c TaxID=683316 RepID=UPI0007C287C4|nr:single-stranded DNA-binding protein [Frankia sp. EI5c]OAA18445.1 single-strand binding protein [Frankia sp. EI5c]
MSSAALCGRLADDPVTVTDQHGATSVRFTLVHVPRIYSRSEDRWINGETITMPVLTHGLLAEQAARTLHAASQVMVIGELRSYDGTTAILASDLGMPLSAVPSPR